MKRMLAMVAIAAVFVVAVAPAAMSAPSDGSGRKEIVELDEVGIPIFCDEDEVPDLWLDLEGWFQIRFFDGRSRSVELDVFHINGTYSNAAGDTWVWRDRGPDHYYLDGDGNLIVAITGRTGLNNIGHVVFNLDSEEVLLQAGRTPFGGELFEVDTDAYACETLTT